MQYPSEHLTDPCRRHVSPNSRLISPAWVVRCKDSQKWPSTSQLVHCLWCTSEIYPNTSELYLELSLTHAELLIVFEYFLMSCKFSETCLLQGSVRCSDVYHTIVFVYTISSVVSIHLCLTMRTTLWISSYTLNFR